MNKCPRSSKCINTKGNYTCQCSEGYKQKSQYDCEGMQSVLRNQLCSRLYMISDIVNVVISRLKISLDTFCMTMVIINFWLYLISSLHVIIRTRWITPTYSWNFSPRPFQIWHTSKQLNNDYSFECYSVKILDIKRKTQFVRLEQFLSELTCTYIYMCCTSFHTEYFVFRYQWVYLWGGGLFPELCQQRWRV